jgi:hypothetical protein
MEERRGKSGVGAALAVGCANPGLTHLIFVAGLYLKESRRLQGGTHIDVVLQTVGGVMNIFLGPAF